MTTVIMMMVMAVVMVGVGLLKIAFFGKSSMRFCKQFSLLAPIIVVYEFASKTVNCTPDSYSYHLAFDEGVCIIKQHTEPPFPHSRFPTAKLQFS